MVKIVILMLLFFLTLEGRENPFFFDSELKQLPYTSNLDKNLPPLKRAALTLPSTARVIEKVTVSYKTLNGSIEEKTIILGNSIDWHLPIFISQNYSASEVKKDIKVKSNTLKNPAQKVNRSSDKFIEIAKRQYIKFLALDKKLKLITKSKKIRDFLLVKPHRIVIDFKKKSDILSYVKKNPNSIFKTITIGNHEGYYRVVIELDGYYGYSIKELTNGYLISLK